MAVSASVKPRRRRCRMCPARGCSVGRCSRLFFIRFSVQPEMEPSHLDSPARTPGSFQPLAGMAFSVCSTLSDPSSRSERLCSIAARCQYTAPCMSSTVDPTSTPQPLICSSSSESSYPIHPSAIAPQTRPAKTHQALPKKHGNKVLCNHFIIFGFNFPYGSSSFGLNTPTTFPSVLLAK